MPGLLFVNKNAKSTSIRHSTDDEKASINAHVQRGRKHVRRDKMQIVLDASRQKLLEFRLRGNAASATLNREDDDVMRSRSELFDDEHEQFVRGLMPPWKASSSSSSGVDDKLDQRSTLSQSNKVQSSHAQQQLRKLPLRSICCEGESMDPFNSSCIKVDGEVHALLRFYEKVIHPNTWNVEAHKQPQAPKAYRFSRGAQDLVQGCFEDEMNMYCMLARTASEVQVFHKFKTRLNVDVYIRRALAATRHKIAAHQKATGNVAIVDMRMILNVYYLAAAEWYRLELDAGFIHLRAVKQMVDCIGGLKHIDEQMREMVILGDTYMAAERLAAPLLDALDFDPGPMPDISKWSRRHGYSRRNVRNELLSVEHQRILAGDLRRIIEDLDEYVNVLVLSQQHPGFPPGTPHWIHLRDLATRNRLLGLSVVDAQSEVVRVALIMWELMVMTVAGRKRTIKLLAPKLKGILLRIKAEDWIGHETVLCWVLSIGSMSAMAGSETEAWFTNEIVKLPGLCWSHCLIPDEDALRDLAHRFFYLDSVQELMIRDLAFRIAAS